MKASAEYLEAAKIEDVASELEAAGYAVTLKNGESHPGYDLTASKNSKKIAVEVKAQSHLQDSLEELQELRQRAREEGYAEFRLVVVNPPRRTDVHIWGLDKRLQKYLADSTLPELKMLSAQVVKVTHVEIDYLHIYSHEIKVRGVGAVQVKFPAEGQLSNQGEGWNTSFPLTFDCELDHNLSIRPTSLVVVDTSSYYD